MVAAKVIAQLFAAQSAPEWMSVGETAPQTGDVGHAVPSLLVWGGPVLLLVVASLVLTRFLFSRMKTPE